MVGRGSNIQLETMKDREYAQFIHQTKKGNKSFLVNNPPPYHNKECTLELTKPCTALSNNDQNT